MSIGTSDTRAMCCDANFSPCHSDSRLQAASMISSHFLADDTKIRSCHTCNALDSRRKMPYSQPQSSLQIVLSGYDVSVNYNASA